jgi:hypothetical protein
MVNYFQKDTQEEGERERGRGAQREKKKKKIFLNVFLNHNEHLWKTKPKNKDPPYIQKQ